MNKLENLEKVIEGYRQRMETLEKDPSLAQTDVPGKSAISFILFRKYFEIVWTDRLIFRISSSQNHILNVNFQPPQLSFSFHAITMTGICLKILVSCPRVLRKINDFR